MKKISIRYLRGVGPQREAVFNQKAGIYTIEDLLYYFPFRYEDRTNFVAIGNLKEKEAAVVEARVAARRLKKIPYSFRAAKIRSIFEIILKDSTGQVSCLWFNQEYLYNLIKAGQELIIYGKPSRYKGRLQIVAPKFELGKKQGSSGIGKITPIYKLPSELSQRYLRKTISLALEQYQSSFLDPIPFNIRSQENTLNIAKSFQQIHFPDSLEAADLARQRFIFEELFISQIMVHFRKARHQLQKGPPLRVKARDVELIKKNFPFLLTQAQEKSLNQILSDLVKDYPMHRLLQGDVGSGKTAVAIFPIILAALSGWQAAFMVPTEVLAYQHKQTIDNFLNRAGSFLSFLKGRVELLTSSLSAQERKIILGRLRNGDSLIAIGTHSLIQKSLRFKRLGVVVIDEQHKFGVAQRALLPKKTKISPNCLVMSATPIPRSLALSLYGDLDCSIIDRLPPGRARPDTILVSDQDREKIYNLIEDKIKEGRQAYIVYPIIDSSDDQEVKSLNQMYEKIEARFFRYCVGAFHGRLKSKEKVKVIKQFQEKKIDILVSTNVVEVGLDIANATIMVVESPQKFGLAQLHQLRGRIQRSEDKATFILVYNQSISEEAMFRLELISKESDGFRLAEEDLKLRGPGDFFGRLQHGLPDLRVADPIRDLEILKKAGEHACTLVKKDPGLNSPASLLVRECIRLRKIRS